MPDNKHIFAMISVVIKKSEGLETFVPITNSDKI